MRYLLILFITISYTFADTIHFKNLTKRTDVTVTEETYKNVVYNTQESIGIKIDATSVSYIDYSDAPAAFREGKNAYAQARYEKAILCFQEALEVSKQPPVVRDWISDYVYFYLGKAYQDWGSRTEETGKWEKAIASYEKMRAEKSNARFLIESYYSEAQCRIYLQDYKKARAVLDLLLETLATIKNPPEWVVRVYLLEGDLLRQAKNEAGAIAKYEEAQKYALAADLPNFFQQATISLGKCYVEAQEFTKAKAFFQKMQEKYGAQNAEIEAILKNGLALCAFHEGQYRQARNLAVDVILSPLTSMEQQLSALWLAGQSYEKLSAKDSSALQSATVYYEMLGKADPNGEWGQKALQRLQSLKKKK